MNTKQDLDLKIIILDTETTGKNDPEIIEMAYISVTKDKYFVKDSFVRRYSPSKPIELGATATHHIFIEELDGLDSFDERDIPEIDYLIGHNVDYDWERIGNPPVNRICTLALAKYLLPELDSHTQTALIYHFEGRSAKSFVRNAHSAATDVEICRRNLLNLIVLAINHGELDIDYTMSDLYELSEEARIPKIMYFGKHKGTPIKELPWDYKQWLLRQPDIDPYLYKALKLK